MSEPGGARGSVEAAAGGSVFRVRTVIILVLVGVFAFSGFLWLAAHAPAMERDMRCRSNVYSKCAVGFAGLEATIRLTGVPTLISRSALPPNRTEGLLIATPEPGGGADIGAFGFKGPILVVLPKWFTTRDPGNLSWGLKVGLIPPPMMPRQDLLDVVSVDRRKDVARPVLTGAAGSPFEGLTLTPGPIDQLQTLKAQGWTPVLTDQAGGAVIARAGSTQIYVLADPDLLNTQGLANLDTFGSAAAIVRALRAGDGPVIFDATLNGYKLERSALTLIFDPPFLAVTLCVAAALALAGLQAAFRFGPVRRAPRAIALGKEALTDNSAQLIRLAGREGHMADDYAALTRKAAARAVGAPRELAGEALTGFLDRLGAQRGLADSLAGLSEEADRARAGALTRAGLTALAGRLYRWRLEMTRERG